MKTSSHRYHYDAKQGIRNDKAEKMTRLFDFEEKSDRTRISADIGQMPSPRDSSWADYIQHRLRVMENGIATYSTRNYARLRLDKHMEWHRAIDKLAGQLTNHKPAIVFVGAGQIAPNSPISIRKHVRCPGTRKLVEAFEKRGCYVFMVDEWRTSQLCGRCLNPFPRRTKSYRFKKCDDCHPNPDLMLPTLIVTNVSKRALQMKRAIMNVWNDMANFGNAIAVALAQRNTARLVSKKQRFWKTWAPNAVVADGGEDTDAKEPRKVLKTVWHRDISAAKLILFRGNRLH